MDFAKGRRWVAKHLPQRSEMPQYGDRVSAESREILLGDYGVESFIEDYAVLTIRASGDSLSTKQTYTQWVYDETRHSKALWYCLVDSGLYSQQEVDRYAHECGEDIWTFERQTGYEARSEEHTSELQSLRHLVCRLLLEKKKKKKKNKKTKTIKVSCIINTTRY